MTRFLMLFISLFMSLKGMAHDFGAWDSPITAQMIAKGQKQILNLCVEGENTYWCELRPQNAGRYTVVKRDGKGIICDVTPPDFNVRTFVHEYGGGAFTVADGKVYASNGKEGGLYECMEGVKPRKLTDGRIRFADLKVIGNTIFAIGESHEEGKVTNFLATIDILTGKVKKIATGHDFYSSPAISPDGKKIAWICWNHPNMSWMQSELWVGDLSLSNEIHHPQQLCGFQPEAVFQPTWSEEGVLYFVTDREKGWWNLHRLVHGKIENLAPMEGECAEPMWIFGLSTYAFIDKESILFTFNREGGWHLALLDLVSKKWKEIPRTCAAIHQLRGGSGCVRFLEKYRDKPEALVEFSKSGIKVLHTTPPLIDASLVSHGEHLTFPSGSRKAFGFFYPPKNPGVTPPKGRKPPLIVTIHGGPTAQASSSFDLEVQFWTSRGFALLDVNYGGSTGYGRAFRTLLDGSWGVVDVEDCVEGAHYLCDKQLVDPERLAIRGGSAGGFTTLAALSFEKTFKAGASYYGVADLTALASETHKFESRYLEQLLGPSLDLWKSRSPIHAVDQINSPLILFQGEEDPIVPKNQSIMIYEALKARGIPTELYLYPGEEHGFRKSEHIAHSLEHEVAFYRKVFGLH